jgi:hypothetical protein
VFLYSLSSSHTFSLVVVGGVERVGVFGVVMC